MTQIFIGNLSFQTNEDEVRRMFERFGRVSRVQIATDRSTGRPRGFAFVNMPRLDDADEAIHRLDGTPLQGRTMSVREAHQDTHQPSAAFIEAVAFLDSL